MTPLHVAAQHGWVNIVRTLDGARGAQTDTPLRHLKDDLGWRPVEWAVLGNHNKAAQILLRRVNDQPEELTLATDVAVYEHSLPLIDVLFGRDNGADMREFVMLRNKYVPRACRDRHWSAVVRLVNQVGKSSWAPQIRIHDVWNAIARYDLPPGLARMMLTGTKTDLYECGSFGEWEMALARAAKFRSPTRLKIILDSVLLEGRYDKAEWDFGQEKAQQFLVNNVRPSQQPSGGALEWFVDGRDPPPLTEAVLALRTNNIEVLLKSGAAPDRPSSEFGTALQSLQTLAGKPVRETRVLAVVKLLVAHGAAIRDKNGLPPKGLEVFPQVWQYLLNAQEARDGPSVESTPEQQGEAFQRGAT
ncbi:uncharacterized protein B0I36DRAFT_338774 [Microdochium trichocladiopsis]|uniref:Ankyrin repeat-containing domain protein n=1 Tax=Microdochium trichocladiopsis TaxID=1682393 RepID=A0A9P8XUB9_9PEZI|nr:uncharacterized protein B0I36DRAFT_338774 [Microdochium trichocladiopsis]KAH7014479.1 hypothetical protein B0I36DRAFT_338774 [Microdochium trichocladiopsis]